MQCRSYMHHKDLAHKILDLADAYDDMRSRSVPSSYHVHPLFHCLLSTNLSVSRQKLSLVKQLSASHCQALSWRVAMQAVCIEAPCCSGRVGAHTLQPPAGKCSVRHHRPQQAHQHLPSIRRTICSGVVCPPAPIQHCGWIMRMRMHGQCMHYVCDLHPRNTMRCGTAAGLGQFLRWLVVVCNQSFTRICTPAPCILVRLSGSALLHIFSACNSSTTQRYLATCLLLA